MLKFVDSQIIELDILFGYVTNNWKPLCTNSNSEWILYEPQKRETDVDISQNRHKRTHKPIWTIVLFSVIFLAATTVNQKHTNTSENGEILSIERNRDCDKIPESHIFTILSIENLCFPHGPINVFICIRIECIALKFKLFSVCI